MDELEHVSGDEFHRATRRFRQIAYDSNDSNSKKNAASKSAASKTGSSQLVDRDWPKDSLGPGTDPFSFLINLKSHARRRLLEAEHPLNVAMIMTALSPAHASAITRELDPAFRMSVIRRLCHIDVVDDAMIMDLRFQLRMRAKRMLAIEHCTHQGITVAADLLSVSDRRTQDSVIAWLSDRDRELGEALQKRVMTLKDLIEFNDDEILKLLKRVDTSAWAGALRSTKPSVAKRVLECMAPKASNIVTLEMANFDPLDEKAMHWAVERVMTEAVKLRRGIPELSLIHI